MLSFRRCFSALSSVLLTSTLVAQDVTFTIDAAQDRYVIPEEVYGTNDGDFPGATVHRHGGNRHTGLNWENNASNAGSDYFHQSDSYLGSNAGVGATQTPGALLEAWVDADRQRGMKTIITLPLAGYVAADMNGPVTPDQTAPSARWKQIVIDKPGALSLVPDQSDGVVYLEEMVNFLVQNYGTAANGGVAGYSLDNEPALWPHTHPRIHPDATGYQELVSRHVPAARMVTALDSSAKVYGPVLYGWSAHLNLQDAPDASGFNNTYDTFTNYYLAQMKSASDAAGRRLLHRYDMHWYPEARGDNRIVFGSGPGTDNDIDARLQAPRSLWDPDYVENSWITQYTTGGEGIRLLPRLQQSVDQHFSGTGLAVTEYNYGGTDHISGGVAQADVLGIFGRFRVAACFWPLNDGNSYVAGAFQLYRNYDGEGARFGSVSLQASASDNSRAGVHAARAADGKLTVVAINRSRTNAQSAQFQFALANGQKLTSLRAYRLSSASTTVQPVSNAPTPSSASFSDVLPAMSATLYELQTDGVANPPRLANISTRVRVQRGDKAMIGGFIVTGSKPKKLMVRAIGPSLQIAGKLANPTLQLLNESGTPLESNDNWGDSPNRQAIIDSTIAPKHQLESAIIRTVAPGAYTAVVRAADNGTGVGLVEVYDLDDPSGSKLANISTRGVVQTGNDVMIGGTIVLGSRAQKVLIRALGPSLKIRGKLANPKLELRGANGELLAQNNNWRATQENAINATGIPPSNNLESAIVADLAPAPYTAIVRGVGETTGIALVEIYALSE